MPELDPDKLAQYLADTGATWQSVGLGVAEAEEMSLGYDPAGDEMSLELRSLAAQSNLIEYRTFALSAALSAPASWDWRKANGQNYVTPVTSQGGCGSCVAFSTCATVEIQQRIQTQNPGLAVNLSEAHVFFCHGAAAGRTCANGWNFSGAFGKIRQDGVVDEKCFPYKDHDQACNLCADWQQRLTKISGVTTLSSAAAMKQWLATHGPLATGFTVYQDFRKYSGGVYRHAAGTAIGGHAVCVVGYDDGAQCWIVKNSWGSGWGEKGFFRIGYGECGIDALMWGVDQVL